MSDQCAYIYIVIVVSVAKWPHILDHSFSMIYWCSSFFYIGIFSINFRRWRGGEGKSTPRRIHIFKFRFHRMEANSAKYMYFKFRYHTKKSNKKIQIFQKSKKKENPKKKKTKKFKKSKIFKNPKCSKNPIFAYPS